MATRMENITGNKMPREVQTLRSLAACAIFFLSALFLFSPSQANAQCAGPVGVAGEQIYNADHNVMQYCNGSDWIGLYIVNVERSCSGFMEQVGSGFPIYDPWQRIIWQNDSYLYATTDTVNYSTGAVTALTFDGNSFTEIATFIIDEPIIRAWGDGTYIYVGHEGGIVALSFNGTSFTEHGRTTAIRGFSIWGDGTYIYASDGFDTYAALSFNGTTFTVLATGTDMVENISGDESYIYFATRWNERGLIALTFNGSSFTEVSVANITAQSPGGGATGLYLDENYIFTMTEEGITAYSFNGTNFMYLGSMPGWFSTGGGGYLYGGSKAYSFNGTTFTEVANGPVGFDITWFWGSYIYGSVSLGGANYSLAALSVGGCQYPGVGGGGSGAPEPLLPVADNLGNHVAEKTLQMEDYEVININTLNFSGIAGDAPGSWSAP